MPSTARSTTARAGATSPSEHISTPPTWNLRRPGQVPSSRVIFVCCVPTLQNFAQLPFGELRQCCYVNVVSWGKHSRFRYRPHFYSRAPRILARRWILVQSLFRVSEAAGHNPRSPAPRRAGAVLQTAAPRCADRDLLGRGRILHVRMSRARARARKGARTRRPVRHWSSERAEE
jgi:hypothetical protein